jgi:APA family basic amino acid/polyamine antiporter
VIFFAYIGFDAVSTAAQEAKNPQRDMPIGILGSLVVCTILYVLVSSVMVGLVPYTKLGVAAPMAVAIDAARERAAATPWAGLLNLMPILVKLGALAGLSSVMVVMILAQPRIFFSMANDGLLPAWAKKVHPSFEPLILRRS